MNDFIGKLALNESGELGIVKCRKSIRGQYLWVGVCQRSDIEKLWLSESPVLVNNSSPNPNIHNREMLS
jgi:hypothetical protein